MEVKDIKFVMIYANKFNKYIYIYILGIYEDACENKYYTKFIIYVYI